MTATLSPQVALTEDQLRALALRLGIREFPTVLAVRPRPTIIDSGDPATERTNRELLSRNLIVDGSVHEELVPVLQALHRPDHELAMRLVTPDGTAKITAVRRGALGVLARRIGDDISLRTLRHGIESRDMASALLTELPQAKPADIQQVAAPLPEFSECLSATVDPVVLSDRIRALGAESRTAMLLGTALASRQAFAEVVHYALLDDAGRISRSPAAVAVFYTKRGRIVGAPNASPAGQLWATLKAGSDHAVLQAIGQLVELCADRWSNGPRKFTG